MALFYQTKLALVAASANNICLSQTPGSAGNLTLNGSTVSGGVATLDTARRVLFTPAAAEATNGTIWTVSGTNRNGHAISEIVNGVNNPATVYTNNDFLTVTQIAVNKAQAGAVTVGTNGIASSSWWIVDRDVNPVNIGVGVVVSGTINYTVEYTYDDPNAPFTGTIPTVFAVAAMTALTGNGDSILTYPIFAIRVTQNSFTNPATVAMIARQAVITPS